MFSFFRRSSRSREVPATIRTALAGDGLAPSTDPAAVQLLEQHGSYSGRKVSFFRVFDAAGAAERGIQLQSFADLDAHPELVLGAGHVENGGAVVLTGRSKRDSAAASTRQQADRRNHVDDERVVFPNSAPPVGDGGEAAKPPIN